VVCATPVPGTITNQTGPATFVDCYGQGKQGLNYQWQWPAVLSDKANSCAHFRANEIVQDEKWLIVVLYGLRDPADTNDAPYPPATTVVPVGSATTPVNGTSYTASGTWVTHSSNCHESTNQTASAGSLTVVSVADSLLTVDYDLTFTAGHFTGTLSAPLCDLTDCPPRPSKSTCVAS